MKKTWLLFAVICLISLGASAQIILEYDTSLSEGTTVFLPLFGSVNVTVDWGDGSDPQTITSSRNHSRTYASEGVYTVTISGFLTKFGPAGETEGYPADKLIRVKSLNINGLQSLGLAFWGASNLIEVPATIPATITDVRGLFMRASGFNQDIGNWNVGNVTDMRHMFEGASAFNQDIGSWNVGNVANMNQMFRDANSFNQDIGEWNVASVTNMTGMFHEASSFNQDIGLWNVGNVTEMGGMFYGASSFNQYIGWWNIRSVTSLAFVFFGASSFNQDIGNWSTDQVTDMSYTFGGAQSFNQDLSKWNTSSVTNMSCMFLQAGSFNQDIGGWHTGQVIDMSYMFYQAQSFNQDVSNWNTGRVINMSYMFTITPFNHPIASWDIRNVRYMNAMFGLSLFNQDISGWDVSNVTEMGSMFSGATAFNQDISGWNVGNVTEMGGMFYGATAFNQDISSWNVGNVTRMDYMFASSFDSPTSYNPNIGGWDVGKVTNMHGMFSGSDSFNQDIGSWDVGNVTNMSQMFHQTTAFNQDISGWDVSNVTEMGNMFNGATAFNQDIGSWNVGNVMNMAGMFSGANSFNQDIGEWNVGSVTNMTGMFYLNSSFNQDIGGWDVGKVTNMYNMFQEASVFNQDIGSWNVGNVTDMSQMFMGASAFNQYIGDWNVENVIYMNGMFRDAFSFDQNIGKWDVSSVSYMWGMFWKTRLSTRNYNQLLTGWAERNLQNHITFNGGESQYSPGEAANARQRIIDNFSWVILDGGLSPLPVSETREVTEITYTSARSGGQVTADGGSGLTAVGVVWSRNENPCLDDNEGRTTDELVHETNEFVSELTGLEMASTYYVRAYAINTAGAGYGESIGFTTNKKILTLSGTFTAEDKIYDGQVCATWTNHQLELNGIAETHPRVALVNLELAFEDALAATEKKKVIIRNAVTEGEDMDTYELSLADAPTAEARILQKELVVEGTFQAADKEHDGTTTAEIVANNLVLSGVIGEDEVELINIVAAFEQAETGTNLSVYISEAELGGTDKDNYSLSLEDAPTTTAAITSSSSLHAAKLVYTFVYPNPFSKDLFVNHGHHASSITVFDTSGRKLFKMNSHKTPARANLDFLQKGLYFIAVENDLEGKVVYPVIKH